MFLYFLAPLFLPATFAELVEIAKFIDSQLVLNGANLLLQEMIALLL